MKKILILGSGGAGKSTFARCLGEVLNIDVIHLDRLYWRPNWEKTPKDEWAEAVRKAISGDSWIIDGNFGGTRRMRIEACDTVIILDLPRLKCLYRVVKRAVRYRGKSRPDMAEGCNEKIDLEFMTWVWNYPSRSRKVMLEQLEEFSDKKVIFLSSDREVDTFLKTLR
jgi:adenylate kinase family enzyme